MSSVVADVGSVVFDSVVFADFAVLVAGSGVAVVAADLAVLGVDSAAVDVVADYFVVD